MKKIIIKPFKLTRDDGSVEDYGIGEHDMPEFDAKHWFTQLFSAPEKAEEDKPKSTKAAKE